MLRININTKIIDQNNKYACYCWKNYLLKVEYDLNILLNNICSSKTEDNSALEKERICNEMIIQNKLNEFLLKLPEKSAIKSTYAVVLNTFPEYYDLKYLLDTNIYNTTRLNTQLRVILAIISKTYTYKYNQKYLYPSDTMINYNLSVLSKYNASFKQEEVALDTVINDAWVYNYS